MSRLPAVVVFISIITASTGLIGNAFGQTATIKLSADSHDSRFFGEGVLQVVVTDPDADNDDTIEEIQVDIAGDPKSSSPRSESIIVPETSTSSGRFEFFLVHVNSVAVGPEDLDSDNNAGVEGDGACVADCTPFVTFGPDGDLDIQSGLYEEVRFEITAAGVEVEANYEESSGVVKLDRDAYGTSSYVYISIVDQDANLNPFERDEFMVDPENDPNDDLLVLDGGSFEDAIVFRETGDNTAVFEGRYRLGESILASTKSLVLTLFEKANYDATLAAPENDSNDIDQISFTIGDSGGTIEVGGNQPELTWDPIIATDRDSYSVGESVYVTITDKDANTDVGIIDSIQLQISSGDNKINVLAVETAAETGVFEASFQLAMKTDQELGSIAPGSWAKITYTDERPADYSASIQAGQNPEKDFTLEFDVQLPIKTGIETTNVTAPVIKDLAGKNDPYTIGSSLVLSTRITNNNDQLQPFVDIIEVRDDSGITVFLALRSGILDPSGSSDILVSWQPEEEGEFEVRTFSITSLSSAAEPLSPPAVSKITVSSMQ